MQFLFITLSTLILVSEALKTNNVKPKTKFNFVGDTAPLGYFDPLNFIDNKSENFLKYLREAELQHSRVAMTAMIALPLMDYNLPNDFLAIDYISSSPLSDQLSLFLAFGYIESKRLMQNYNNPFEGNFPFTLKDDCEPGKYVSREDDERLMNVELNNGRLAMIACLGYIVQEMVTQQAIF